MLMKKSMSLLVVLVALLTALVWEAPEARSQSATPIRELVGVNVVVTNNPSDVAQAVGWVRDYHKWYWYEATKGVYTWSIGPQKLDSFYNAFKTLGVKVMPNVEFAPGWATSNGQVTGIPDPVAHARYLGALVSHYGDTIAAIENYNEPDQWWQPVPFPPNVFGTMMAGDYDAVKAANPNMPLVMAGLSGFDGVYLDAASKASGGKFDVINLHYFAGGGTILGGTSPEAGGLYWTIDQARTWRDANAPGKPIWISEFGWDTYMQPDGRKSNFYAPEATAANYLLRALLLMQARGVDKGFVFQFRDQTSDPNSLHLSFASAGVVAAKWQNGTELDGRKKPGWYYLATLKNVLGDYVFDHAVVDGPNVFHFEYFVPGSNKKAAVLWARSDLRDRGYQVSYQGPAGTLIVPTDGSTTGTVSTTTGNLTIGERPVFILYTSGTVTGTQTPTPTPSATSISTSTPTASATPTATAIPTATATQVSGTVLGPELLTNPGFEGGATAWNLPSWFTAVAGPETGVVHSGAGAFHFIGKGAGPYIQQDVAARPGTTINFSGWVNVPIRTVRMSGLIELQPLNSNKGAITTFRSYTFSSATSGWVEVADSRVMPSSTAWVRLRVRFLSLDGTVYLDDLSLRVKTSGP